MGSSVGRSQCGVFCSPRGCPDSLSAMVSFGRGSGSAVGSCGVLCVMLREMYPPAFHPVPAFPFLVEPADVPFMIFSLTFCLLLTF